MSLLSAFNAIDSSLAATSSRMALVARNIANVNTPGYTRKTTTGLAQADGVQLSAVTRAANEALREQATRSISAAANASAVSDAFATLAATASAPGQSVTDRLSAFHNALETYMGTPANAATAQAAVASAKSLAGALNSASAAAGSLRSQSDAAMSASVDKINALLKKFGELNRAVVAGRQTNLDVTDAMDSRDGVLADLAKEVGVSTTEAPNGSLSLYTDSGVTLFQDSPRTVSFAASNATGSNAAMNAVVIDGVPVTGASAPMALRSGTLAGLAKARDVAAPAYLAQLDQIANALVSAFREEDQSGSSAASPQPGLFTFPGAAGMPTNADVPGLAGKLTISANVDPELGGNANLLRDGGISAPGNPAYTYNSTGAAAFTDRIQSLIAGLNGSQAFDPAAGLGGGGSIASYAEGSLSWVQAGHQQASAQADFHKSVADQASAALANATGVNLDMELSNMLSLENSYGATAKLLTTAQSMFATLMSSVGR